jgi:hypothetical protein
MALRLLTHLGWTAVASPSFGLIQSPDKRVAAAQLA